MGNFYVNFSVKRDDPQRSVNALRRAGCKAYVTPPSRGYVVVYEEESDNQDTSTVERVGALLSSAADAPVLAVLNHDDDILCYWLFEDGRLTDSYNSRPDYFDESADESDQGGDARRLSEALSAPSSADEIEAILRMEDVTFAVEQHARLAEALGLPGCSVGLGYRYVEQGEAPEEWGPEQWIRVG